MLRSYAPARVVLEGSTPSEWLARHLESTGLEVVVADPNVAPMDVMRQKKLKAARRGGLSLRCFSPRLTALAALCTGT